MRKVLLPLALLSLLILFSCTAVQVGPVIERDLTLVHSGTPATITDKHNIKTITLKDGTSQIINKDTREVVVEGKVSNGDLSGMMVIDEPTLRYYMQLHQLYGADYAKRSASGEFNKPVSSK